MEYQSIHKYASGMTATICRRGEAEHVIRLNDEDDVEVMELQVEGMPEPPADIAAVMAAAYISGRDDGRHQMMDVVTNAARNAGWQ